MNATVIRFADQRVEHGGYNELPGYLRQLAVPQALFINLSSGAEWLPLIQVPIASLGFLRLQSTACEQKRWDFIIRDLDQNLLLKLAVGFQCEVYDCGARKDVPRAIWQGLAFIHYVLTRRWQRRQPAQVPARGHNVAAYFEAEYRKLSDAAVARVDYFRDYYDHRDGGPIHLVGISCASRNDGDKSLHAGLVELSARRRDGLRRTGT